MWNKLELEYGTSCIQVYRFYSSVAISDLGLDVLIYFLPIPHLWQLHLPIREKLAVIGIFLLGSIWVRRTFLLVVAASNSHLGYLLH
ncbi:hypothetical protein DL766_008490 [Monosporascus sp. MC13-8B]|uniref:Rhodopsin domain-containing protein n=1 Tax=Monosporascus cannonballus TaxID=155416 RepID=A0ABY0GSE7_9PEZI|nr:hypothetical protein DL762_009784 [Monosporascus cannonballus]RYO92216.1 hypothetical protein DL763_004746 [Monosporascus cannonballus]RYP19282.1 hypothetical protein DL766_008490 [Monosporascus sp. MC13-8B]